MRYIDGKELINSKEFVEEPVKEINKKIEETSSKRIVLYGTRGTGKTSVLYSNEKEKINSSNPSIYTRFESMRLFGNGSNEDPFNMEFINHYYELAMAGKILYYLKQNHNKYYEKELLSFEEKVDNILLNTNKYIRHIHFRRVDLEKKLEFGEITSKIIEKMKKDLGITSVHLLIDRFDWTDNRSRLSQEILKKYFELFDKVVISIDDEDILNEKNQKPFQEQGYKFVKVDYGKEKEILKQIISLRIKKYNENLKDNDRYFSVSLLTDEIIDSIISETNGNISMALIIMNDVKNCFGFMDKDFNIEEQVKHYSKAQTITEQAIKKISYPPKFYL